MMVADELLGGLFGICRTYSCLITLPIYTTEDLDQLDVEALDWLRAWSQKRPRKRREIMVTVVADSPLDREAVALIERWSKDPEVAQLAGQAMLDLFVVSHANEPRHRIQVTRW